MIVLGLETSCDETACGIVESGGKILANHLYSQIPEHAVYGGVVPEIASRAHLEKIGIVVDTAMKEANISPEKIDLIAHTRGPGLMGPLLVGTGFAKGLARKWNKPITGVNHLEGHIAANHLTFPDLKPPFLCLTVSGGHTELCVAKPNFEYEILGRTRDDAAGEAFDKCGKLLGLGYPAGPLVSKTAAGGNRDFAPFPRGLRYNGQADFSFSGLKTAVLRYVQEKGDEFVQQNLKDIAASLEEAIVSILVEKSLLALKQSGQDTIAICGGVSANRYLRSEMDKMGQKNGFRTLFPDFSLCTDNGAMIAEAALLREENGFRVSEHKEVVPWLKLG